MDVAKTEPVHLELQAINVQYVPTKRGLFAELKKGMDMLAAERKSKATLPELKVGKPESVEVNSNPETLQMPDDV